MKSTESASGATSAENLAAIFQEFTLSTPYTSVSAYYEYCVGIAPDPRYGDNCVGQALRLGKILVREGFDVRYLRDGRHLAFLCRAEDSTFYVDPYLMPLRPILFSGPGSQAWSRTCPAFPLCANRMGCLKHATLRVGYCPRRRKLFVRYSRFSSRLESHAQSRAFEFVLDEPCRGAEPGPEDLHALLFHEEQNNLSVRAIDRRDLCMIELIYPICGIDGGEGVSRERLVLRCNADIVVPYSDRRFAPLVEKLASSVGSAASEIVEYILGGVRVYKTYAPPGVRHAPYQACIP